jgi:hypothetical protein
MGRLDSMGHFRVSYQNLMISIMVALHVGAGVFALPKDCSGFASIEGRGDQSVLQEIDCHTLSSSQIDQEGFIMGYGGALTLVNGSPFDWVTSSSHSYQMDTWNWPTVNAGTLLLRKFDEYRHLTCHRQSIASIR